MGRWSILGLLCALAVNRLQAEEPPIPYTMAVLGDSISEGMFSDFSLEHPPSAFQLEALKMEGKVGDFEFLRKKYANRHHNWATGDDESDFVESHYKRLKTERPQLKAYNYAVSGAWSKELPIQAARLLRDEQNEPTKIDYILVLIGANDLHVVDISKATPPEVLGKNIETGLRMILEANPDREILLVQIPDMFRFFEESYSMPALTIKAWNFPVLQYSCNDMRREFYGPLAIFRPDLIKPYRTAKTLLESYREKSAQIVTKLQKEFPRAFMKTIQPQPLGSVAKDLSIDCFHPSEWGQADLAEATWTLGFWPEISIGLEGD